MKTGLLSAVVALLLGSVIFPASGQQASVMRLDAVTPGKPPFQKGDCLEIRVVHSEVASPMRITIIDIKSWPWVCVKDADGEWWLNFSHVLTARCVVAGK